MANYFSNLSATSTQSRFLSNKDKDSQASSTTVVTTTTASSFSGAAPSPSRVPSKHFSTTLSDEQKGSAVKEKSPTTSSSGLPSLSVHPLRSTYVRPSFICQPIKTRAYNVVMTALHTDGCSGSASSARQEIKSRTTKRASRRYPPLRQ
jgi:hypothetical protein